MRIMGFDPGSRIAGFAVIESNPKSKVLLRMQDFKVISAGVMRFSAHDAHSLRVAQLFQESRNLLEEFEPDFCVIERAFCGVNVNSALKLGESRGALIASIHAAGVPYHEITPAQVKRIVVGSGQASKEQIAGALRALMNVDLSHLPFDASDALAIALSFGVEMKY